MVAKLKSGNEWKYRVKNKTMITDNTEMELPNPNKTIRYNSNIGYENFSCEKFVRLIKDANDLKEDFYYKEKRTVKIDGGSNMPPSMSKLEAFNQATEKGMSVSRFGGEQTIANLEREIREDKVGNQEMIEMMQLQPWNVNLRAVMPSDLRLDINSNPPEFFRALTYLICKRIGEGNDNFEFFNVNLEAENLDE